MRWLSKEYVNDSVRFWHVYVKWDDSVVDSRVGRFLTKTWFWMKVPSEYIHFYEKVPKIAKKNFLVKWPLEERSFFAGSSTI
jgi:hypothetical protein